MSEIDPVLILSTGRCGSTMISEMLNGHPKILSLSEFFVPLGTWGFAKAKPTGRDMWKIYSRQSPGLHAMLEDGNIVSEGLYPFDAEGARFSPQNIPPILCVTLPHLTPDFEALYDEIAPVVQARPKESLANHYRFLFDWLRRRMKREVWIERSGGSLMKAAKLIRLFPEARVIHVYRDGRDTAMSMSRHHNFRVLLAAMEKARKIGIDIAGSFASPKLDPLEPIVEALFFRFVDVDALKARPLPLEAFGRLWSQMILSAQTSFASLPPNRFLEVRFEDVQERPRDEIQRLITFIDPSLADEEWIASAAAMPRSGPPKYLGLEPEQRARLTEACAPGLRALEYAME